MTCSSTDLARLYLLFQVERAEREVLTLDETIKEALVKALIVTQGHPTETAKLLKVSRSSVYRMMERYQLQ